MLLGTLGHVAPNGIQGLVVHPCVNLLVNTRIATYQRKRKGPHVTRITYHVLVRIHVLRVTY